MFRRRSSNHLKKRMRLRLKTSVRSNACATKSRFLSKEQTMNLKPIYDAVVAAEAKVQSLANQINTLFNSNETAKALELRPQLDAAKADAKAANDLYLSMRNAVGEGGEPAKKFVPMGGDSEPKEVTDMRASREYSNQFWTAFRTGVSPRTITNGQHSAERYGRLM